MEHISDGELMGLVIELQSNPKPTDLYWYAEPHSLLRPLVFEYYTSPKHFFYTQDWEDVFYAVRQLIYKEAALRFVARVVAEEAGGTK